jgi:Uncharacterized protein conserved in bacteria
MESMSDNQPQPNSLEETATRTPKAKLKQYLVKLKHLIVDPNESDLTKSISVAVGVFISIIPLWGFQTIVAVAASFIFRLNKPLVIAASYFSVPPMTPFVLYFSVIFGGIFVSKPVVFSLSSINLDILQAALFQYVVGSLALAVVVASAFGLSTSLLLKVRRR